MKKYFLPSLKLTLVTIILCSICYPLLIALIAKLAPGRGDGEKVMVNGKVVGYANVGQRFSDDKYFWGRPSAVDYNSAGSGGSNKGPSNADYLKTVADRIDSFLVHNPQVKKEEIPAELVTASGSGLDPHISPKSARVQIKRIAAIRKLNEDQLVTLVQQYTEKPLLGLLGPEKINVLKLNIALDNLK
ncbi:potassium-transporting ATPase subunit C [Niastella yeongjuensis]|uniref:Potassium-transporting ATPase KdpC subunit n=1 Tax=Niastella yeongjuensis TaxID=354355 RepID=A0A1V9E9M0_9BACT|nr:K(+)-transporting ATPase subunit C [Niastella yeongjuensis]OQP42796.1 potassium-transporting ATPase subunit C [Niastella yeongjuensis]SEO54351.1 K+-transporting ATPase ATPase C chain [Niastella yeongjuensis]